MKEYRTKDGQEVEFITHQGRGMYCLVGYVKGQYLVRQWSLEGDIVGNYNGKLDGLCLVEVSAYEDLKIDDPVVVWDSPGHFQQRAHFAGIAKDGRPKAWKDGRTSWTALNRTDLTHTWNNCERAEE